jgi:hypothetical protein
MNSSAEFWSIEKSEYKKSKNFHDFSERSLLVKQWFDKVKKDWIKNGEIFGSFISCMPDAICHGYIFAIWYHDQSK